MNEEISRLQQQAEQGDAEAQYNLGCNTYAVGASQSHKEITKGFVFKAAREWLEKAVAQGHEEAKKTLKKLNEDISRQVSCLQQEAEQGDPDAQYILSSMYAIGDMGVPQNNKKASEWGLKAAKQGHAKAIEGHAKGIELLKMAAKAGDANAQFTLGKMYCDGEDVSKSYDEAAKWFQKAVAQGHAEAQHYLGVLYQAGRGVPQNYDEAAELFYKAGAQGLAKAQVLLDTLIKTSRLLSAECIQKIAQRGHALAQTVLGEMYRDGKRVPQNYTKAFEWYEKAAIQGQVDAQFNIGCMYRDGVGVSKNRSKAIEWFRRAAQQGDSEAQTNLNIMLSQSPGGNGSEKTPEVITIAPRQSAEPKGFGWFIKGLKHYADFKGRARREEFWMFALFYGIFLVTLTLLAALFRGFAILGYVYGLALLLPSLAVGVRRLHDSDRSGWWMLLLLTSFIPFIGIVGPIALIVLMCLDSQPGSNTHGSNPKGVEKPEFKATVTSAGLDLQDTNAIYEFALKWIRDGSKDRKTGLILLETVAYRGHARAMDDLYEYYLGNVHHEPKDGMPVNLTKAEYWIKEAMKVDDIEVKGKAFCNMGHRQGETIGSSAAYPYYAESAKLGYPYAVELIGNATNYWEWQEQERRRRG